MPKKKFKIQPEKLASNYLSAPANNYDNLESQRKPEDNATVGATIGTDLSGGSTDDNTINSDGIITNLKAQHIIAPSDFTAGEALVAGDAVYFKASDSEIYKADTDADESTYSFIGFARASYDNTDTDVQVITGGIITKAGWGLTAGTWYYLSGTAGAISATPGTRALEVGIAISATELLIIQRKPRVYTGTANITGVNTSTITCGFRPVAVYVNCNMGGSGRSVGYSDGTSNRCLHHADGVAGDVNTTKAWKYDPAGDVDIYGVVDTFTATGFRLNNENVGTGTPVTKIIYIAFG